VDSRIVSDVTATIALYALCAVTNRKPAHGKAAHRQGLTEQEHVGTKEQENIGDQPDASLVIQFAFKLKMAPCRHVQRFLCVDSPAI